MVAASVFTLAVFVLAVKADTLAPRTLAPRTFGFPHHHYPHHAHTAHGGHGGGVAPHGYNSHALPAHGPHSAYAHQVPAHPHPQHAFPGHQRPVGDNVHVYAHQGLAYPHQQHAFPGHQRPVGDNVHVHAHQGPARPHQQHAFPGHQRPVGSNAHVHAHQGPARPHQQHTHPGHQHHAGGNQHGHNHPHSSPATAVPTTESPATVIICRVVKVTATPAAPAAPHSEGGSFVHHHVFGNLPASLGAVVGKVAHPVVSLLHNASTWLNHTIHGGHGHSAAQPFSGVPVAGLVRRKIMQLVNRHTGHTSTRKTSLAPPVPTGAPNFIRTSSLAASGPTRRGSDGKATPAATSQALLTTSSPTPSAAQETTLPSGTVTLGNLGAVATNASVPTLVPSSGNNSATVSGRSGEVFTTEVVNTSLSDADVSTRETTPIEPTHTTEVVTTTAAEAASPTPRLHRSDTTTVFPTVFATATRRLAMPTGQPSATTRPAGLIFSDVTLRPFPR